jgi:hypothetical protein
MKGTVTTTDSDGACPTQALTATVKGTRYTRDVAADGTIRGPGVFIEHLIDSEAFAEEAVDSNGDGTEEDSAEATDESAESGADADADAETDTSE